MFKMAISVNITTTVTGIVNTVPFQLHTITGICNRNGIRVFSK